MAKTSITRIEQLQLIGLFTLAREHVRKIEDVREAVYEILDTNDVDDARGWVNDFVWCAGETTVADLLEGLNISVEQPLKLIAHYIEADARPVCGDIQMGDHHRITADPNLVTCKLCEQYVEGYKSGREFSDAISQRRANNEHSDSADSGRVEGERSV